MIWTRTPAGLAEVKRTALIQSPVTRNLLMVIDGAKSEAMLLKHLIGIQAADFRTLHQHGLIEPATPVDPGLPAKAPTGSVTFWERAPLAAVLTRLIAAHLGLGGLALTSSVQRARTVAELLELARTLVRDVERRAGKDAAEEVRARIFGHVAADRLPLQPV